MLLISNTIFATTLDKQNTINLTVKEVCTLMGGDGVIFAQMYKDGKTAEDIIELIQTRIDREPITIYALPGIRRILEFIENVKRYSPDMYNQPNFPAASGIATRNVCLREQANSWTQDIPDKLYIIKPLVFPSSSPKVKM